MCKINENSSCGMYECVWWKLFSKTKTNAGQREAWKIHKHNIVYSRLENLFHKWVNGVRAMIVENNSREIKATEDAPGVYLFLLSVSFIFFFLSSFPLTRSFSENGAFPSRSGERRNSRFHKTIQVIRPIKRELHFADCRDFQELEGVRYNYN